MNQCAICSRVFRTQSFLKCSLCSESICWRCEKNEYCKNCLAEMRKPSVLMNILNKNNSNIDDTQISSSNIVNNLPQQQYSTTDMHCTSINTDNGHIHVYDLINQLLATRSSAENNQNSSNIDNNLPQQQYNTTETHYTSINR